MLCLKVLVMHNGKAFTGRKYGVAYLLFGLHTCTEWGISNLARVPFVRRP
jgi:hypothetical protein